MPWLLLLGVGDSEVDAGGGCHVFDRRLLIQRVENSEGIRVSPGGRKPLLERRFDGALSHGGRATPAAGCERPARGDEGLLYWQSPVLLYHHLPVQDAVSILDH